jgi:hypothetical protein
LSYLKTFTNIKRKRSTRNHFKQDGRAVLVWIHGGGFVTQSAASYGYHGICRFSLDNFVFCSRLCVEAKKVSFRSILSTVACVSEKTLCEILILFIVSFSSQKNQDLLSAQNLHVLKKQNFIL